MISGLIVDAIHIVTMGFNPVFGLQVNIPLTIHCILYSYHVFSLFKHVGVHSGYSCHFDEERHF